MSHADSWANSCLSDDLDNVRANALATVELCDMCMKHLASRGLVTISRVTWTMWGSHVKNCTS